MPAQFLGHLVEVREQAGEGGAPSSDDRILHRHHVEGHITAVGVHHGFHRVAYVVGVRRAQVGARVQAADVGPLRIGITAGRGVGVQHIVDPTGVHHRVHVGVELQERSDGRRPLEHVTHVYHLGVRTHVGGYQRIETPETQCESSPPDERADADAPGAVITEAHVRSVAVDVVHLVAGGADQGVPVQSLAHVDLGLLSSPRPPWSPPVWAGRRPRTRDCPSRW